MGRWFDIFSEKLRVAIKGKEKKTALECFHDLVEQSDTRLTLRPLGGDWLCPYTGRCFALPGWDGAELTLLEQPAVVQHLSNLPPEPEALSRNALLDALAAIRLREIPSYKMSAEKGFWICPHCLNVTEILLEQWDGTLAPQELFAPLALAHLNKCAAYLDDPLNFKTPAEVTHNRGEGGLRAELLKRVAFDPVFRVCDDSGAWICPFSQRPIPAINALNRAWDPLLEQTIVDYLLSKECPGRYSQWNPEVTVADLQRLAGKFSAGHSQAAVTQSVERELAHLRRRVDELGKKAAIAFELWDDLDTARKVQLQMLPAKPPQISGYEITAFYQPSAQLGGDLYHFLEAGPGRTGLLIGDVSGHGVAAAVIMAMTQKAFAVRAAGRTSPAEVANGVHGDLTKDLLKGAFVTCGYTILEHATGKLRYVRAGHPPALLVQPDGAVVALAGEGMALGLGSPAVFAAKLREREALLPPGGLLLLYTDGLTEAMDAEKREFTEERVRTVLGECRQLSAQDAMLGILAAVRQFVGARDMEDDLTLVVVKRLIPISI